MFFNYSPKAEASKSTRSEEEEGKEATIAETAALPSEANKPHGQKTHVLICPRCQSYLPLESHNQEKKS